LRRETRESFSKLDLPGIVNLSIEEYSLVIMVRFLLFGLGSDSADIRFLDRVVCLFLVFSFSCFLSLCKTTHLLCLMIVRCRSIATFLI
jgi:hypothetical protein